MIRGTTCSLVPEAKHMLNELLKSGLTINKAAGILKVRLLPWYLNLDGSGLN